MDMFLVVCESIQRYEECALERYFGNDARISSSFSDKKFLNNLDEIFEIGVQRFEKMASEAGFKKEELLFTLDFKSNIDKNTSEFCSFFGSQLLRIAKVIMLNFSMFPGMYVQHLYFMWFAWWFINCLIRISEDNSNGRKNSIVLTLFNMGFRKESILLAESFRAFSSLIYLVYYNERDLFQRSSIFEHYAREFGKEFADELFKYLIEKGLYRMQTFF